MSGGEWDDVPQPRDELGREGQEQRSWRFLLEGAGRAPGTGRDTTALASGEERRMLFLLGALRGKGWLWLPCRA